MKTTLLRGLDRRSFLSGMAAWAAVSRLPASALEGADLKIGVMSDIHIGYRERCGLFESALRWYDRAGADAVLVAGDIANWGRPEELTWAFEAWQRVFPNDRASDGRKVERLFITGNHDFEGHNYGLNVKRTPDPAEREAKSIRGIGMKKAWETAFHEEWSPVQIKRVKGYDFVLAHYTSNAHSGTPADLAAILAKLNPDPAKPFFYAQHVHPCNTCFAPFGPSDDATSTRALSKYPNAVAFSGHAHFSLTDERNVWQGAFTSIGTSSMHWVSVPENRENSIRVRQKTEEAVHMGAVGGVYETGHAQLVTVREGTLVIERRVFPSGLSLGPDWVVPLAGDRAFAYERRARELGVPQFPKDAAVTVSESSGKTRRGAEENQVLVSFPPANAAEDGTLALDYEVRAIAAEGVARFYDVAPDPLVRRVLSPTFTAGASKAPDAVVCAFGRSELPVKGAKVRFAVTPCNSFGVRGRTVTSDLLSMK